MISLSLQKVSLDSAALTFFWKAICHIIPHIQATELTWIAEALKVKEKMTEIFK